MPDRSLLDDLKSDPRIVLFEVVLFMLGLGWGLSLAVAGPTLLTRVAGVGLALASLIYGASFVVRYHDFLVNREWWSRTWVRRSARAVLRTGSSVVTATVVLAALLFMTTSWLVSRL